MQVIAHMMPDLPNVGWERDIESFREFFENPAFRSDGLKVYPTLVIRGTGLYELWKAGLYRNYEPVQLIDLVARILALVPPWVSALPAARQLSELQGLELCLEENLAADHNSAPALIFDSKSQAARWCVL